jgi:hypothetical protein
VLVIEPRSEQEHAMHETMNGRSGRWTLVALGLAWAGSAALAQQAPGAADSSAELAKKLSNPVASLISVPLKLDWDTGIGPLGADRSTYVVQPVIPISLGADWNLISRTIIPYIDAQSPVPGGSHESGLSDITQSFFFSPSAPTAGGWIWGAGPVLLLKTASNDALGSEKWGVGPTAVLLRQDSGLTYGVLANHIWSFGGNDQRADISATFLQPFLSYTTKTYTTWGINTESTYDWENSRWTVPINVSVSQLVKFGAQPVSFALGARSYLERPEGGPDWGLRLTVTFLFPK